MAELGLNRQEGGVVLGAVLSGDAAEAALERLAGPWGARCQAALDELSAQPTVARRAAIKALSTQLLSPLPDGYRHIDADALAGLLSTRHPQVAAAVVQSLPPPLPAVLASFAQVACRLPTALRLRVAHDVLGYLASAPQTRGAR